MPEDVEGVTSRPQARTVPLAATRPRIATIALLVITVVALGIRMLLYQALPAVVPADAWDFLRAARDLYERADFFSSALRDVRLPGYPTFLAVTLPLTGLRSDAIVVLQSCLGIATVAAGWCIGELLGSRPTAIALATFLAVNPVYLLNEHAIMSETLALALDVTLVAAWLLAMRRPTTSADLLVGALLGVAILVRANCLAFGAALLAGLCLRLPTPSVARVAPRWPGSSRLRPAFLAAIATCTVLAPWVWRNDVAYGRPSVYLFGGRNTLVYMAMHLELDRTLPTLARVNGVLDARDVDYAWLWKLGNRFSPQEGEALARRIIHEEIAAHPGEYLHQVGRTALAFVGVDDSYGNERASQLLWFRLLVGDVAQLDRIATAGPPPDSGLGFVYVPSDGNSPVSRTFSRFGQVYLRPGRAIGLLTALALMAWFAFGVRDPRRRADQRFRIAAVLVAGYLITVAMHAAMLTDADRYSSVTDFLPVVIVCLIAGERHAAARAVPETTALPG
jgi:hypothetical protein